LVGELGPDGQPKIGSATKKTSPAKLPVGQSEDSLFLCCNPRLTADSPHPQREKLLMGF
jgi:hypothetical protein